MALAYMATECDSSYVSSCPPLTAALSWWQCHPAQVGVQQPSSDSMWKLNRMSYFYLGKDFTSWLNALFAGNAGWNGYHGHTDKHFLYFFFLLFFYFFFLTCSVKTWL